MRRGDFGRLGHGDCNDVFIPRAIGALRGRAVMRVACGDTHTLAVTEAGELYTFGRNSNGQLGHGSTDDSLAPRLVEALKVRLARLVVVCRVHVCHDNTLYAVVLCIFCEAGCFIASCCLRVAM